MGGKRRLYGALFREGAVRIVLEAGKSAAVVARDLGVHEGTLQAWVHRARARARADAEAAGGLSESGREELRRLRVESSRQRKEIAGPGMERGVLERSVVLWVKGGVEVTVAGFMAGQGAGRHVPRTVACRALEVSESWFCKWRRRPSEPTKRMAGRAALAERITHFFSAFGRAYGSPRITLDRWAEGWQVSRSTVAEIMAEPGLQGRKPPRRRRYPTRQGKRKAARGLVLRRFGAIAPDVLRWGDMAGIETGGGRLCLASVHGAFSRRVLGCAMGSRHDAALASAPLQMAAATRGGRVNGVIFHSGRGRNIRVRHTAACVAAWARCSPWGAWARPWTTRPRNRSTRRSRPSTSTGITSPPAPRPG
ncbi:transposase [Streptomyces sp. NPDC127051]|uniref:transposase n=1 Tax=Streptomyces sp. NPDC127051 TaxID=3347119 RepID=UPI0036646F0B